MWFTLSAVCLALLQALDLFFILVAINLFGFSPVEVGLASALWTVFFIMGVRRAGYLTNRGLFGKALGYALALSILLASLTAFTFVTGLKALVYASYLVHALALSITRVTVLSFVFEYFDYTSWRDVSVKLTVLTMFFEGVCLSLASRLVAYGLSIPFASSLVLAPALLVFLAVSMPTNIVPIERRLFMIDRLLNKALSNLSFAESTPLVLVMDRGLIGEPRVSARSIYLALMGFVTSSEIYFTTLPFILLNHAKLYLDGILLIYGLGKALSSIIIYLSVKPMGRSGLLTAVSLRFLAVTASYLLLSNVYSAIVALSIIYFTGVLIDTALLNLYNEVTYGYGLAKYTGLKEFSSLIGSAACGFIYRAVGLNVIPLGAALMLLSFLSIIIRKW